MKKLTLSVLVTTVLFAGAATAFADDNNSWTNGEGTEDGKGAKSHAHMILKAAENPDVPTDPMDPSDPDGGTGNVGTLTIDNVTPLEFGEHELSGGESVYYTMSKNPNVQITDNRGEGNGWTLQVTSSSFTDINDKDKQLKGAVLTLPAGEIKTTTGNVSNKPVVNEVSLNTDEPSTETLMMANPNSGMGTWEDLFDSSKLSIKVPAGNFAGEYVSTLTWTMLDTPTD